MNQYKVTLPDSRDFVNRKQLYCPVCNSLFVAYAEGYYISIRPDSIYVPSQGPYWSLPRPVCSERCAQAIILADINPFNADIFFNKD